MFPILQSQPSFNPILDAPGVFAWYHANNVYGNNTNPVSGTSIATLSDLTSNSFNFTEVTGSNQPTFTTNLQNGHPGIIFTVPHNLTGPNSFLTKMSGVYTIYIVMSSVASFSALPLVAVADDLSNRFNFIVPNSGNTSVYMDYGDVLGGHRLIVSEADIYATTYAHCFQLSGTALTNFRNNVNLGSNNNAGTFTPGAKVPHMGWSLSDYIFFEMICCNQLHNAATRTQVFSYLNNYWRYE